MVDWQSLMPTVISVNSLVSGTSNSIVEFSLDTSLSGILDTGTSVYLDLASIGYDKTDVDLNLVQYILQLNYLLSR